MGFGRKVQSAYSAFNAPEFVASVMDATWNALPLKAQTRRISITHFIKRSIALLRFSMAVASPDSIASTIQCPI